MAPTLGQGANSALVDAAVLTAELTAPGAVSDALSRYTLRRRITVATVQNRADRLVGLSRVASPALCPLRDMGMRLLGRVPGASARMGGAAQQEAPASLVALVAGLADR